MAQDIFQQYTRFGEKINGIPDTASFQTQTAVPLNIQTPYSQVEDDDGLKPLSASDIKGGRYFDAVCAMDGTGDFNGGDSILEALNAGHKRIFVKAGIYPITKTIQVRSSNVLIHGEDKNNTIIINLISNSLAYLMEIGHPSFIENITIENISFDINYTGYGMIKVETAGTVTIQNCVFVDAELESNNIDLFGTNDVRESAYIYNNIGSGSSNIEVDTYYLMFCKNNNFTTIGYGILTNGSSGSQFIINNYFNGSGNGYAVDASSGDAKTIIANNIITNGDYGLDIFGTNGCIVANNIISNNQYSGINISSDYNIIINNQISKSGQGSINYSSIDLASSSYNIIADNQLIETDIIKPNNNIDADAGCDYNIYKNNVFMGATVKNLNTFGVHDIIKNNLEI